MFLTTHLAIEADHHRQALLADAANYRLAKLARAARRRARRPVPVTTTAAPEHVRREDAPPDVLARAASRAVDRAA